MSAQDSMSRERITDSCRVVKSHASFIGIAAADLKTMPVDYVPVCLAELNETKGVLRRALAKIEQAELALAEKPRTKKAA